MEQWLLGDLPSWIAVVFAVAATVMGYRALHPKSYIEFHPDWKMKLDVATKTYEYSGSVTAVGPAAYIGGSGELRLGGRSYHAGIWAADLTQYGS